MLYGLQDEPERSGRWLRILVGVLIAGVLQGGGLWGAHRLEQPKRERRKAITMRVVKVKPKPKPKPKPEPKVEPKPEPPKPKPKPKPKKKKRRKKKPKPKPKPKPKEQVAQKPPPEPPPKPPVLSLGLTMSSTSAKGKGGFKVNVGNTMYGKPSQKLKKPNTAPPPTGDVSRRGSPDPVVVPAKVIYRFKPKYTPEAEAEEIEGKVILRITIDTRGRVTAVKLIKGLGYGLDEAAIKAARQWKFKPETVDGKPVQVQKRQTITFTLED
jgi:protein TonB